MRRTRITTVTREITVIRPLRDSEAETADVTSSQGWCERCDSAVNWLTPEQAAAVAGLSPRQIYRLVEAAELHFAELSDRSLRICAASLPEKLPPRFS